MSDGAAARVDTGDARRERAALAGLVLAIATPLTYSAQRCLEWALGEGGSPAMVLRAVHTVYYWRAGVALWWGVAAAGLGLAWLRRHPERAAGAGRWLALLLPITGAITLAASFAVP